MRLDEGRSGSGADPVPHGANDPTDLKGRSTFVEDASYESEILWDEAKASSVALSWCDEGRVACVHGLEERGAESLHAPHPAGLWLHGCGRVARVF